MEVHREESRHVVYGENECWLDLHLSLTHIPGPPTPPSQYFLLWSQGPPLPPGPLVTAPPDLGMECRIT